MAHFSRNNKVMRPIRPSCPEPGRFGRDGRVNLAFLHFYNHTINNHADFVGVISRGVGIREIVVPFIRLFYGKAIVENENWLSQSIRFFTKEKTVSHFRKTEDAVHDRDIADRKGNGFP